MGHSTEACYATGKKEKPMKRDYNNPNPRGQQPESKREDNGDHSRPGK